MPTTQSVDNAFQPAVVETTTNFFNPGGPVAGRPFVTVIDTPDQEGKVKDVYTGTDEAEEFQLKEYSMFTSRFDRTHVRAGGGDDVVRGTRVVDHVRGGTGNDIVFGGFGDDFLLGGDDNDQLYGQQGADVLFGQQGADYMDGGVGNDYMDGGNENDLMYGASGDDRLFGGDGQDAMYGGVGRDILTGGNGNDFLNGDQGNDVLTGGSGADTFIFSGGMDVVTDFSGVLDGDKINFGGFQGTVSVKEFTDKNGTIHTAVSKSADNFMAFKNTRGLEVMAGLEGNLGLNIVAKNFDATGSLPGSVKSLPQDSIDSEDFISSMTVTDSLGF